MDRKKSVVLSSTDGNGKKFELMVGPVLSPGKDLSSGKNRSDYINKKGRMDLLLRFYIDHK